ncbi:hypothetical protein V6Z12_A13G047100 [Gossypium hirsutum]|nr:filament-like plant protein 7 isoform X2 [Gossypium hirsutum]
MDQKTWLWRKKCSLKRIDEEVQMPDSGRDRIVKNLNEKLASVLLDCHAKEDVVTENVQMIQESNAGREKAEEADATLLKEGIDEALRQGKMADEKLARSDAAMKPSSEFERATNELQDKLTETNRRIEELVIENSRLSKALVVKEKLIEDQRKHKSRADAEFSALMARLDVIEKENAFLKYEFHVVEKELEIRNEEMEYNRRLADLAHKQHLDSVKRITKLEAECQKLLNVEEENMVLKAIMIHSSNLARSQTSSRPTEVEVPSMELVRSSQISSELSVTSGFDIGSINGNSSYCSWTNGLVSESEVTVQRRVKNQMQHKAITVPEMRLMDDFEEMEKLALVSGDGYNQVSDHCGFSNTKGMNSRDLVAEGSSDWLQVVLHAIFEHKRVSDRSLDEIIEDIEITLSALNKPACSMHTIESDTPDVNGYIAWKSLNTSPTAGSVCGASSVETLTGTTKKQHFHSNLRKSICKIIELIEGTGLTSYNTSSSSRNQSPKQLAGHEEYFVRVFQCQSSELETVLEQFLCTCDVLLNQRADLENFAEELSFALDWIVNNCATPTEASSARNEIKRHFGCNIWCSLEEENKRLKSDLKNMEARIESETRKGEALTLQLRESEESIGSLQAELKKLKESNDMMEDQVENQKSINEDLETQITVSKAKLNETFQKCSSLEVELEYKNNCCEELEEACFELQLQLESVAKKETPKYVTNQECKQSQNGWEITAASVKLAECQETIMNIGKQLKVLASPHDAALLHRVFSNKGGGGGAATTVINNRGVNKRFSLRDRMLADGGAKEEGLQSPNIQGTLCIHEVGNSSFPQPNNCNNMQASGLLLKASEAYLGSKNESGNAGILALAIVPSKKQGFGFLRRLLFGKKKGHNKKSCHQKTEQ